MVPSSFCSLSTFGCHNDLFGLLLSLSIHHPNAKMYCFVDTKTKQSIESYTPKLNLKINWQVILDKYTGMNRQQMVQKGVWSDFQMQKAVAIHETLKFEKDVLFLDADILILDKINDIDPNKELGVSPHYIKKKDTDLYGYYNGGVLWTNQKTLKDDWIKFTKTSRYFDQASIEDLAKKYNKFEFEENYNFSWWRLIQSNEPPQKIVSYLSIKDKKIYYKNKILKFVHTHFKTNRSDWIMFNNIIKKLLHDCRDYKSLLIISRIEKEKWVIQLPKQPMPPPWNHSNDSFREHLILLKNKNKDLQIILNSKSGHLWLNNNILLYDRPTNLWFNEEIKRAYKILLGNGHIKEEGLQLQKLKINVSPWIFWPRRPMVLENILQKENILDFNNRKIESIFIGNYENNIQEHFRKTKIKWNNVISEFHCIAGNKHKFTQEEYLHKLRNSRYGLCLRGFGSKCHREVELMSFGTVPLVTKDVSIDSYIDKPIENKHYIRVNSPTDLKEKISNITEVKWRQMSKDCYEWYQRNVHSNNCWNNTLRNILYT